ncbi:MAG: 50S ribosome-binding GTPase [Gemmataceae bacterium]|nr:50S ribosome-binding GTPase [Gemmataceae bacterium]MDW8264261.1 GTPase [Gemmataceae bacterium]
MTFTRAACLSPPGTSAIAVVGVRGPRAWPTVRELFRPRTGRPLPDLPPPRWFGLGAFGPEPGDEVVVAVKETGSSASVEIHCHGGFEVVRWMLGLLAERGIETCSWQEWLGAEAPQPLRVAAAVALARAPTVRTAAILLDQYHGAFEKALEAIRADLQGPAADVTAAADKLDRLVRHAAVGRHLTEPWRVVLAGAPNVGKSSLMNALMGYARSIVAPIPGTTRDVVTALTAFDGWPVELADTAGLRPGAEGLEAAGMERARGTMGEADLVLWVVDAAAAPVWPEELAGPVLLVVNKIDLPPAWDLERAGNAVRVSAETGAGLADLSRALAAALVPTAPEAGAAVPFTPGLAARCEEAAAALRGGRVEEAAALVASLSQSPVE